MRRVTTVLILVTLTACDAEENADRRGNDSLRLVPGTAVRVPGEFVSSFRALDSLLTPAQRDTLRGTLPDTLARYHMSLGLFLRNGPLRTDEGLVRYFLAHGVRHRDDMSAVVLDAYGQYLRDEAVNVAAAIQRVPRAPAELYETLPPPRR
jgi:hypothetical protein